MTPAECPTGPKLAAFSLGYLPDQEVDAIAGHLGVCRHCEAALDSFGREPGEALAAVRGHGGAGADDGDGDRVGRLLLDLLRGNRPSESPATSFAPPVPAHPDAPRRERPDGGQGPGRLGDFIVVREIGRGGMGVVYEAVQESLGRRVALKVLAGALGHDRELTERFRREAQAAARLHHTNIVAVFGVGESRGVPYYVMQFIEGPGLDRVIDAMRVIRTVGAEGVETVAGTPPSADPFASGLARSLLSGALGKEDATTPDRGGPDATPAHGEGRASGSASSPISIGGPIGLSLTSGSVRDRWRSVARVGVQVASALHYAHLQRTLHRDIKPANLLLDGQGTVWVADFGLAKVAEQADMTRTGDIVGTIRYMAPERFHGVCDARSDVYSLGLTLYELIALRPAFEGRDKGLLVREVTEGVPVPLGRLAGGLPGDLEVIVHKAMEKVPGHRYQTAGDLADDLRRFLENRSIRARRVGPAERFGRWCRRNPAMSALTAAVFALLLTTAVVATAAAFRIARVAGREALAREELRGSLYFSRMNLAQQAGDGADIGRLVELLEPYREPSPRGDLRGFEWYYWWRVAHRARATLEGGRGWVQCVAFAPDGTTLASGGHDSVVRLWPVSPLSAPIELSGHTGRVLALAFSPDGRTVASGGDDMAVRIWDRRTGRGVGVLRAPEASMIYKLAFPDDDSLVAVSKDNVTRRWDLTTERPGAAVRGDTGQGDSVSDDHDRAHALTADGSTVAIGCNDGSVKLRRTDAAETHTTLQGPRAVVRSLAFSRDGRYLAVGYEDKSIVVWDVPSGKPTGKALRGHTATPWGLAFGPSGRTLVSGGLDNVVLIWDWRQGVVRETLKGHSNSVNAVAISPDGDEVATAGVDRDVKLWDVSVRVPPDVLAGHEYPIDAMTVSADGSTAFAGGRDGAIKAWTVADGKPVGRFAGHSDRVRGLVATPDGKALVSAGWDNAVKLWDPVTGALLTELVANPDGPLNSVLALAVSPGGKTLAWSGKVVKGTRPDSVTLWDLVAGEALTRFETNCRGVWKLEFSRDGKALIVAGFGTGVTLWDASTGKEIGPLPMEREAEPQSLALSPDGRLVAAGLDDGRIALWDYPTRQALSSLPGHGNAVSSLTFSRDGSTLASGGRDQVIKLWDVASGQLKTTLHGHTNNVMDLAFTPRDGALVSASLDGTVRLWRAASPEDASRPAGLVIGTTRPGPASRTARSGAPSPP